MPAKAWGGTDLIPLPLRYSMPSCMGQEPDRISDAPSEPSPSPLKVQLPNLTVQAKASQDAARSPSSASKIRLDHDLHIVMRLLVECLSSQ
jgi:hypothetical protein